MKSKLPKRVMVQDVSGTTSYPTLDNFHPWITKSKGGRNQRYVFLGKYDEFMGLWPKNLDELKSMSLRVRKSSYDTLLDLYLRYRSNKEATPKGETYGGVTIKDVTVLREDYGSGVPGVATFISSPTGPIVPRGKKSKSKS